jgi:hypothetical protein
MRPPASMHDRIATIETSKLSCHQYACYYGHKLCPLLDLFRETLLEARELFKVLLSKLLKVAYHK